MSSIATTTTCTKPRPVPRDTGFPEPFHGLRNTTLPHPEADLSPNACISQEDVNPDRALSRSRHSFLRKKRRTLNHGRINPTTQAVYSVTSLVNTSIGDNDSIRHANPSMSSVRPSMSSLRLSRDETDSLASGMTKNEDETPPTSPDVPTHRSKKDFLRKFRMS